MECWELAKRCMQSIEKRREPVDEVEESDACVVCGSHVTYHLPTSLQESHMQLLRCRYINRRVARKTLLHRTISYLGRRIKTILLPTFRHSIPMMLKETGRLMNRMKTVGRTSGQVYNPTLFLKDINTNKEYAVVVANAPHQQKISVLMDHEDYDKTWHSIYIQPNGYAYGRFDGVIRTLHGRLVGATPTGFSIDHLNWQKCDNRRANLRPATNSEQNRNRAQRADKKPPPRELIAIGIHRLPRLMRWDHSAEKFITELPGRVVCGTMSKGVGIVDKFRDALQKLITVLDTTDDIVQSRLQLAIDFNNIVRFAHTTVPDTFPNGPYADLDAMCGEVAYCQMCLSKLPPCLIDF